MNDVSPHFGPVEGGPVFRGGEVEVAVSSPGESVTATMGSDGLMSSRGQLTLACVIVRSGIFLGNQGSKWRDHARGRVLFVLELWF